MAVVQELLVQRGQEEKQDLMVLTEDGGQEESLGPPETTVTLDTPVCKVTKVTQERREIPERLEIRVCRETLVLLDHQDPRDPTESPGFPELSASRVERDSPEVPDREGSMASQDLMASPELLVSQGNQVLLEDLDVMANKADLDSVESLVLLVTKGSKDRLETRGTQDLPDPRDPQEQMEIGVRLEQMVQMATLESPGLLESLGTGGTQDPLGLTVIRGHLETRVSLVWMESLEIREHVGLMG